VAALVPDIPWTAGFGGAFEFFKDADEKIGSFFTNAEHPTEDYWETLQDTVLDIYFSIHNPLTEPPADRSEARFPLCHVWSGDGFETFMVGRNYGIRCKTRLLVWTVNADPPVAAKECDRNCGAIATWLQQVHDDTSGERFGSFYANHGLVEAERHPIVVDGGMARGQVDIHWAHTEGAAP
jgi:hypothetical protein